MKNIFIATDFSPASNNAALYAAALAKQYHANLYLFHAYESKKDIEFITDINHPTHELKEWLTAEAELINKDGTLKLHISSEQGPATETIIRNAKEKKADLVVCAMKDKAKGFKKIFGSTTLSLINKCSIPLLVIPEAVSFKKPAHVALAIDMDPKTSPVTLQLLKNISEQFFSKISVFYALKENYNEDEVLKFQAPANLAEIKHLRPQYEFRIGEDIARAMDHFAGRNAVDMIAVIPHKHTRMERWLTESVTKSVVTKTQLPVLVLPQKIIGVDDINMNLKKLEKMWKEMTEQH